ncbi:nucleotidyltransferase family protein [Pseudobacillus wudalianchiensis]|uniref:MobA-like NTP transferase domain-containing protein n=1 Tax=Pseudobacillus wudalianchiensis TaxID=1743143 RepID=A0A1B9AY20_9BACI|nr:nucleotidyltransferase family protein [Bacillus wudalianchiensis]OCA88724.1 hypothetical protein A8F95_04560 [Bacillus wudalianchiensis]
MNTHVHAIILAAGTSSRMGRPKQLLPLGEHLLLGHVINRVLTGEFTKVTAVIGHEAALIQELLPVKDSRFQWVLNEDYHSGQSSSLKRGIESLGLQQANVMVFLGDLPFIEEQTIHTIYQSGVRMLKEYKAPFMIRPVYKNIPGHPVFFGHIHQETFSGLDGDQGGRAIVEQFAYKRRLLVEDEGILLDIDTPIAYEKAKERFEN